MQDTTITPDSARTEETPTQISEGVVSVHVRGETEWTMERLENGDTMSITDGEGRLIAQIEVDE
jgi:hypothetical protein